MDEETARSDVEKLQDLLESIAGKSKKQKGKTEEQCITFENMDQYPSIMWQSAWELDWDKVQALYCPCIGIPAFIIDNSIVCPVVIYGIAFQSSTVDRLRGPQHFICPCGVVLFDAVEPTQCGGGARAGQLQE